MSTENILVYEVRAGEEISDAALKIVNMSERSGKKVKMQFNGVELIANVDSISADIVNEYHNELDREQQEREDWLNNTPEGQAQKQENEERTRKYEEDRDRSINEGILEFTLLDTAEARDAWQNWLDNNQEGYGAAIMRYTARWANYMERAIEMDNRLEDIADKRSHDADLEGITGFQHGAAVNMLSKVWIYGDDLRKWHNKEYDYDGEGTVNPALLTIGNE